MTIDYGFSEPIRVDPPVVKKRNYFPFKKNNPNTFRIKGVTESQAIAVRSIIKGNDFDGISDLSQELSKLRWKKERFGVANIGSYRVVFEIEKLAKQLKINDIDYELLKKELQEHRQDATKIIERQIKAIIQQKASEGDPIANYSLAKEYLKHNRVEEAEYFFNQAFDNWFKVTPKKASMPTEVKKIFNEKKQECLKEARIHYENGIKKPESHHFRASRRAYEDAISLGKVEKVYVENLHAEIDYELGVKALEKKDKEDAKRLFEKAMKNGHMGAYLKLIDIYVEEKDTEIIKELNRRASMYFFKAEFKDAQFELAKKFEKAAGAESLEKRKDDWKFIANHFYKVALLHKQPEALFRKAQTEKNLIIKMATLQESASQGYTQATLDLAQMHIAEKNYLEAEKLLKN